MFLKWFRELPLRIVKAKLFISYEGEEDNWDYQKVGFSLKELGCKSNKDISVYFRGESKVNISNVDQLCNWLIDCEYISFDEKERENEDWGDPLDFERNRKGNCVDFSLWAWRKLSEMGYDSEFFVGEWVRDGGLRQHAWVTFRKDGNDILLNTVSKEKDSMCQNLSALHNMYIPWSSVNKKFQCKLYGGYCSAIKRKNHWTF